MLALSSTSSTRPQLEEAIPGLGRCLLCCTRHRRTANSTPLILISRHLAPYDELNWKAVSVKGLFQRLPQERTKLIGTFSFSFFRVRPQFICGYPKGRGLSTQLDKIFLGARVYGIRATWPVHRKSRRL
jgi:hypothetical protein